MDTDRRIKSLERTVRLLAACLVIMGLGLGVIAAAPDSDTLTVKQLNITSPDAKSTLTLSANNTATGMWINDKANKNPQVALYTNGEQAVVGTANPKTGNLDCAIATTTRGSVVQVHGQNGKAVNITAASWTPPAGAANEEFNIQFVPSYNSTAGGTRFRPKSE